MHVTAPWKPRIDHQHVMATLGMLFAGAYANAAYPLAAAIDDRQCHLHTALEHRVAEVDLASLFVRTKRPCAVHVLAVANAHGVLGIGDALENEPEGTVGARHSLRNRRVVDKFVVAHVPLWHIAMNNRADSSDRQVGVRVDTTAKEHDLVAGRCRYCGREVCRRSAARLDSGCVGRSCRRTSPGSEQHDRNGERGPQEGLLHPSWSESGCLGPVPRRSCRDPSAASHGRISLLTILVNVPWPNAPPTVLSPTLPFLCETAIQRRLSSARMGK
jgi:hypothetical protein